MKKKMDVLVDLQFGSTGKGLLAGYLGVENGYDAVVSCNMPNAGHSAYSPDTDQLFVHKVLPSAIFGDTLKIIGVGPGAVFSLEQLTKEWRAVCDYRNDLTLFIHEAAGILLPEHKEREQLSLSRISSTMQGSAEALIDKIRRKPGAIAKHHAAEIRAALGEAGAISVVSQADWLHVMQRRHDILLEGSQGYSLGLSSGFYPYCTSRECTPARVIADCSMPAGWLRNVYGSARVHPIRVGNTSDGYSGDWYPDQVETSFAALGVPEELTTVTKRVRRIATFSAIQIREAMMMSMPAAVFLNFAQYDEMATEKAVVEIDAVSDELGCSGVTFLGWGPRASDIEEIA
jgi:adenylosuccinate synthase